MVTSFVDEYTLPYGLKFCMFEANLDTVGSASVVVPQEASGFEDCHGGRAPFLYDDVPSVATSRDASSHFSMSKPRRVVRISSQHQ